MSKRKDRERAENGLLFRSGQLVPKEEFEEKTRKYSEEKRAKAEGVQKEIEAIMGQRRKIKVHLDSSPHEEEEPSQSQVKNEVAEN